MIFALTLKLINFFSLLHPVALCLSLSFNIIEKKSFYFFFSFSQYNFQNGEASNKWTQLFYAPLKAIIEFDPGIKVSERENIEDETYAQEKMS